MTKLFIVFITTTLSLNALNITSISSKNSNFEVSKDDRKILKPLLDTKVLKPFTDTVVLKPFANIVVLKPFKNTKVLQPYNPKLAKEKAIKKAKAKKIAVAKKEKVKKQFATKIDLKAIPKIKKEDIVIEKESTEFFNTLNNKDSKPIDME